MCIAADRPFVAVFRPQRTVGDPADADRPGPPCMRRLYDRTCPGPLSKETVQCRAPCRTSRSPSPRFCGTRSTSTVTAPSAPPPETASGTRRTERSVSKPRGWPTRCGGWGSTAISESPPSCGTTRNTWRPTSRSRPWELCCTPSTSVFSPNRSSSSHTRPKTRSSSWTCRWSRSSRPCCLGWKPCTP